MTPENPQNPQEENPQHISELLKKAIEGGDPTDEERAKDIADRALDAEISELADRRSDLVDEMQASKELSPEEQEALDNAAQAHLDAVAEKIERSQSDTPGAPE